MLFRSRRAKAVSRGISAGAPVIAAKAENSEIWDVEGNRYIDFGGGIAVVNTGHRHPLVMKRVYEQLEAFTHTCAMVMPYAPFIEVCEKLNAVAPISGEKKTALVTTGAAAALGRTGEIGVLAPGANADITVLSLAGSPYDPVEDPVVAAIFGGSPDRILETIVDGTTRYRQGETS